MSGRSWTGRMPGAYDVVMAPVEALGMRRMRARLWDGLPRGGRGLEIGAGSGAGETHRARRADLVGSDLSYELLRRARERNTQTHVYAVADVQRLPFADRSFDWVVGALLFCEVSDPAAGLREVRRVLEPGGTLHLLEHVRPDGMLGSLAQLITRATGPLLGEHFDRMTYETVAANGFAIEHAEWRARRGVVHLIARRSEEAER